MNVGVLQNVAQWVTKMLRMFGLGEGSAAPGVGWGISSGAGAAEDAGAFDVRL